MEAFVDGFINGQHHHRPRQSELPIIMIHPYDIVEDYSKTSHVASINVLNEDIKQYVEAIKSIFSSMEDGVITPSAYDAAWIARIESVDGGPQFPSCLEWVVNHQLSDGSWGDPLMFSAYDRLINTLACVVALTTWKIHPDKCQKGIKFVNENMNKLEDEKDEHMMIGFEIVFPLLIELARKLEIEIPDSPILKKFYAIRDLKLAKIPKDKLHNTPTSLLYSLEGMKDLEWEKLLKLRCENGSFFFSPAATAYAFMQTKDQKCLAYLTNLVTKFNGEVPHTYPVDMFEHIWIIDRLQRLGISRYFGSEIKACADYIYRYWDEQGIGFGRNTNVPDIDDTAMGFRVLRANGYQISPDVFLPFEKDGHFLCFPEQVTQAVTGMFNLYRASQMSFPGEKILVDARKFSHKFLTAKQSTNELFDKWIITKDLPGEIGYALDVPWYASLPRLEARYYLEQYGGDDDVWIGKTLYRMGNVSNHQYLEMAKLDYNHCQMIHHTEWSYIQKWYAQLSIEENLNASPLWSYYAAAASIFEPERCNERLAWTKTSILLNIVTSYFISSKFTEEDMEAFVDGFINVQHHHRDGNRWHMVLKVLNETLNEISSEAWITHGVDIRPNLHHAWTVWLLEWQKGMDAVKGEAELIVRTICMSNSRWVSEETLSDPQYLHISSVTNDLCHQISHKESCTTGFEIDAKMQQLVQLVFNHSSGDLHPDLKQVFLMVAKAYYYKTYFDPETINHHINKVLFETVI
uniref:ent-copalyl diphosphate synthase 1-like n=1 Tax=Erigeron canadensis TaxID=72917 RepID=UPI001CB9A1E5|nr:ent-copalyl diphosphate synthase 1-like [Erigeron canadensis]